MDNLVLTSSKPLTGRTGYYRLRDASVYWNYWRYSLTKGILPLPDKDSSHDVDDMPCRHTTPLRLHPPAGHHLATTPRRRQTSHRDSLRIAPGHSSRLLHRSSRLVPGLPTTDINHRLLGKTTKWEPISYTLHHHIPRYIPFANQLVCFHCYSCTSQYKLIWPNDAKRTWQPNCIVASIMEVSLVLLAFSLYSLFYAIYPKTTETLLLYSVAYIPQEYLPFTFKPFHHGPY